MKILGSGINGKTSYSHEPKAQRCAYSKDRHPPSVRRRPSSTFSNNISSEAMKPILAVFHI